MYCFDTEQEVKNGTYYLDMSSHNPNCQEMLNNHETPCITLQPTLYLALYVLHCVY